MEAPYVYGTRSTKPHGGVSTVLCRASSAGALGPFPRYIDSRTPYRVASVEVEHVNAISGPYLLERLTTASHQRAIISLVFSRRVRKANLSLFYTRRKLRVPLWSGFSLWAVRHERLCLHSSKDHRNTQAPPQGQRGECVGGLSYLT